MWPRALLDLGAYEVAVSDTIGVAHPGQVWDVIAALESRLPLSQIALHFHDTRGTALANVLAGLQAGVTTFDTSAGGLGGCPYAPGAAGNLATEDLVSMLDGLGIDDRRRPGAGRAGFVADRASPGAFAAVAVRAGGSAWRLTTVAALAACSTAPDALARLAGLRARRRPGRCSVRRSRRRSPCGESPPPGSCRLAGS